MDALTVTDLVKSFGDVHAVNGISFSVPERSFFAFLGPNGAGKSTTISMICSLVQADSGKVELFGKDVSDPGIRRDIGVVFQDPMMDRLLTVRENLTVRGSMYGLENIDAAVDSAIEATECTEFADRRYGTLSGGQRRRADIARALVHSPRMLILDEPTSGLDPHTRGTIWDTVTSLNRDRGLTVFLTTHYMEEASNADDVVVIDHGSIVAHGTPEELKEMHSRDRMTVVPKDMASAKEKLESADIQYSEERGVLTIVLGCTADAVPVVKLLEDEIASFEVRTGSMDEAFVNITGGAQ